MVMLVCFFQFVMVGDVVICDVNKFFVVVCEMIGKYFFQIKVVYIKIEKDLFQIIFYDVKLVDGIELEFNLKGEWFEIDCKNKLVFFIFIFQVIFKYMKVNYNGYKMVKIECNCKGYELILENGLEVDFDQFGGFLKLSD